MNVQTFYDEFFTRADASPAHAELCERVYGKNLCQHGMADMQQLEILLEQLTIRPEDRVLDLGCGNGYLTEYLHDRQPAFYTGVDISEVAIQQAQGRVAVTGKRLNFQVGDISRLDEPEQSFDKIISIDSHYFIEPLEPWLEMLYATLKPGGTLAIFSDEGQGIEGADESRLDAEETLMARRFSQAGYRFTSVNFSAENRAHWRLKQQVTETLHEAFFAEGNEFLYHNRLGECTQSNRDFDCRFLFFVYKP